MVIKNSALMTLFFPTPPVIGSRKSLSEQRSSHSYPFRMCFRHRADAGYFLQPIRFRIGSVYADYICSRCRTYGYVLPIPLKFASAVRCSTINWRVLRRAFISCCSTVLMATKWFPGFIDIEDEWSDCQVDGERLNEDITRAVDNY